MSGTKQHDATPGNQPSIWYILKCNLFTKQKQRRRSREQSYGYLKGKRGGQDELGDWD